MGGSLGNRDDTINDYKKYEHKCNKDMKYLKKQNKMLYRISMKSDSHCELKNINKIKAKASKKRGYYSSNSYSSDSDSDSFLSSDSEWEEERQPTELKEINDLDHVVTDTINTNKNQHNDAIENEPRFDNQFNLSSGNNDPLPVVIVSLREG